jgi:hypothetical protein
MGEEYIRRSKMRTNHVLSAVILLFTFLALLLSSGCCPPFCGGGPDPTRTTGSLIVTLGFEAAGSGFCTGAGTVVIRPATGGSQSQGYSFSGVSGNTSPGCSTGVTFTNLPPGSVDISDSSGATCTRTITAGQFTAVTIRTDSSTCQ